MALEFILGAPGGGKSLRGVQLMLDAMKKKKADGSWRYRFFLTNVPIKKRRLIRWLSKNCKERLNEPLEEWFVCVDECDELFIVPQFWRFRDHGEPVMEEVANKEYKQLDVKERLGRFPDCFYLIDEIHRFFNSRRWALTGFATLDYLSQHRHLGDEVLLVTQDIKNVDRQMRSPATGWRHVENKAKRRRGMFKRQVGSQFHEKVFATEDGNLPDYETKFSLGDACQVYSTSKANVESEANDKSKRISIIWPVAIVCVLVIVGFAFLPKLIAKGVAESGFDAITGRVEENMGYNQGDQGDQGDQAQPAAERPGPGKAVWEPSGPGQPINKQFTKPPEKEQVISVVNLPDGWKAPSLPDIAINEVLPGKGIVTGPVDSVRQLETILSHLTVNESPLVVSMLQVVEMDEKERSFTLQRLFAAIRATTFERSLQMEFLGGLGFRIDGAGGKGSLSVTADAIRENTDFASRYAPGVALVPGASAEVGQKTLIPVEKSSRDDSGVVVESDAVTVTSSLKVEFDRWRGEEALLGITARRSEILAETDIGPRVAERYLESRISVRPGWVYVIGSEGTRLVMDRRLLLGKESVRRDESVLWLIEVRPLQRQP